MKKHKSTIKILILAFVIATIVTCIAMILFVPTKVTGGIAGKTSYMAQPIFDAIGWSKIHCDTKITDGYCYEVLHTVHMIEGILTFGITFILVLAIGTIKTKRKSK